ncbi:MAG: flagellar protein FliT [Hydrogenovibrio sp.]|nr:flagellar protein FliT [Hydrogenovibrio sp.]
MDNQVLQCLHDSKVLLMYAEKGDWEQFVAQHPFWEKQVENCFAGEELEDPTPEMEVVVTDLIEDIDRISELIKGRMSEIETLFSNNLKQKKAIEKYFE